MHPETVPVQHVVDQLRETFGEAPPVALVLGSGLGLIVDAMQDRRSASNGSLGLPSSTVIGHDGAILRGRFGGTELAVVSGRVHLYEGYPAAHVVRYVRALALWGVKRLVLTCSAGGISDGLEAGQVMLITDHLNLQGTSPLIGQAYGTRFPDMSHAYDPAMRQVLTQVAQEQALPLHQGIYVALHGPAYETPAEIRMVRGLGADAVGMSTAPEVLAAAECGLPVCGLAIISNKAAGLSEATLSHDEVTANAGEVGARVARLLEVALERIAAL